MKVRGSEDKVGEACGKKQDKAVPPQLRREVAGFPPRRPEFDPISCHISSGHSANAASSA
jgi:hypothetical protein